jgi:3'-5' exoribonuclease
MLLRDLTDGQDLDHVLLVREVEERTKRDGTTYLKLTLGDRTMRVAAMVWDGVDQVRELCVGGEPVRVVGRFEQHPRYGAQVSVRALRAPAEGTWDPTDLHDGPPRPVSAMEADLRELVASVRAPHLRELLDRVLGPDTATWAEYRRAPAAKHFHQAYAHGLLEHSLTVAQAAASMAATFPGVDRDVVICGALLHDIGKLEAYTTDPACIEMTDLGRLQGEIPLGYFRVRTEIDGIEGFPAEAAQAVLHVILSHHGTLEHGSPVVPSTREATIVHFCDNLGGRLGSFDRLEKQLAPGTAWSGFDRALSASAYFGPCDAPPVAEAGAAAPAPAPARVRTSAADVAAELTSLEADASFLDPTPVPDATLTLDLGLEDLGAAAGAEPAGRRSA